MTKSKRDQQIDKTRRLEWLLYAVTFLATFVAGLLGASPQVLLLLTTLLMGVGLVIWIYQYRAMDEFARLRLLKSWAISGIVTLTVLTGLMLWAAFIQTRANTFRDIPFWALYAVLMVGILTASLSNVYLRKQAERE